MRKLAAVLLTTVVLTAGCAGETERVEVPPAPATVTVTATSTPTPVPDEKKCRAAIVSDYQAGWSGDDLWPPSTRKPVCAGFNRPTLQRLVDEAIDDIMNGTTGP